MRWIPSRSEPLGPRPRNDTATSWLTHGKKTGCVEVLGIASDLRPVLRLEVGEAQELAGQLLGAMGRDDRDKDRVIARKAARDARQPGAVDLDSHELRVPGAGPQHDLCPGRLDARDKARQRTHQRGHGVRSLLRARRCSTGQLIAPRRFDRSKFAQVAAERRLGDINPAVCQCAAESPLAVDRLPLEDVDDELLASFASGHDA